MNSLIYSLATALCRIATSLVYVRLHRYLVVHESVVARAQFRRRSKSERVFLPEKNEKEIDKSARMGIMKMISLTTMVPAASADPRHHSSSINLSQLLDNNERLDSRALIKLIKLATLIPLATEALVLLLKIPLAMCRSDQFPSIPVLRVFSLLLFVPPICNPLLCVIILRPFRQEFERRVWPSHFRFSSNKVSVQKNL
uniref:Uncharacterized protein n=1 Tax=Plectus sambesii TaxID=2011161 RepID=A0A914UJD2_9BILA